MGLIYVIITIIIVRWMLRKWDVGAWTGSICLKIGIGGGHL